MLHGSFFAPHEEQSSSLPELHPVGQQPSPFWHGGSVFTQPEPGSQVSVVHASPSSQLIGSFEQTPPEQESVVQALPSSQSIGVFEHVPPEQTSSVQALPSSQSALTEQPTTPQSTAQFMSSSEPSQVPSPQHEPIVGVLEQVLPLPVQRPSAQVTPYCAEPSPQQYRLDGRPTVTPLQSAEQLWQSSPSAVSQTLLPQTAPLPAMQSLEQLTQSSPDSQVPLPQQLAIGSCTQLSLTHESVVHALPSSQSALVVHSGPRKPQISAQI